MNNIRHIRKRLGVAQIALGKAIGVTQATISNYERGLPVPQSAGKSLIEFAASLGVSITYNDIYDTLGQEAGRVIAAPLSTKEPT